MEHYEPLIILGLLAVGGAIHGAIEGICNNRRRAKQIAEDIATLNRAEEDRVRALNALDGALRRNPSLARDVRDLIGYEPPPMNLLADVAAPTSKPREPAEPFKSV